MKRYDIISILMAIGVIIFIYAVITKITASKAQRINCSAFISQVDAQKVYDSNPAKYKSLMRNKEDIACKSHKYK